MIELYYLEEADSICSNRPRMTFVEKGINDWVPRRMSLMDRDQFKPEYLRLNSKAQVPTLVHDGRVIRESSIICDYIDDLKTEPALKPKDKAETAQMREWIKEMDEAGYQATAALNFVTKFRLTQDIKKWKNAGRRSSIWIVCTGSNPVSVKGWIPCTWCVLSLSSIESWER